jgi:tetratricopeptide (TPR) repeat protein
MSDAAGYQANLQRGQALRQAERYRDACHYFGKAIEADPDEPQPYLELALCRAEEPTGKKEALAAIDQAVSRAPNSSYYLGYKGYLLSRYGKHKEGLEAAERALQISPYSHIALLARCNAFTKMAKYAQAEEMARRMLEMDPNDVAALNLLTQALRLQNRVGESREVLARILALVPNDAFGHANAGYEAMRADDYPRAIEQFLESLRLNPQYEHGRRGLLQALRGRMLIYRINLKVLTWIGDRSDRFGKFVALLCVLSAGLLLGPFVLYMVLAFTLQPLSNFFLLMNPTGRRALKPRERAWALFTGWMTCLLLLVLALAHLFGLFLIVAVYLALFALSVYFPRWRDAWRARREERIAMAERSS